MLENKVSLVDNSIKEHGICEECMEEYVFTMRDNYHEFQLGLTTILTCLAYAQMEGAVPPISEEWWIKTGIRHE